MARLSGDLQDHPAVNEIKGFALMALLFFAGQRKVSKRKAARKLGPAEAGLPSFSNCLRRSQKLAPLRQFVTLFPHAITSLGYVLMGMKSRPF